MAVRLAPRLCIIGAGPIGLEAALRGAIKGWEVTVLEADTAGAHLQRWGHVRLFTPVRMNVSALALAALGESAPDPEALLLGREHVERVIEPLAAALGIRTDHRVISVSRQRLGRTELVAHPLRAKRPFELLVQTPGGEELLVADGLVDASGIFGCPRWAGRGGNPVPGERDRLVWRHLPNLEADSGWRFGAVVVVGNGHSAATAIAALARQRQLSGGPVAWLVPDDRQRPVDEVAQDPLSERAQIVSTANALAAKPPPWLTVHRRAVLLDARGADLVVSVRAGTVSVPCERLLSLCGYRPDSSLLSELAVDLDPAFEGGRGLGAALSRVTDCLAKVEVSPSDLYSGEPDLFLAGHRSYGRRSTFLLQTGIAQLEAIFERWELLHKGGSTG